MNTKLKELRELRGLSIYELEDISDVSSSYINNLENGYKKNPSLKTMKKLAKALNVSVAELFNL